MFLPVRTVAPTAAPVSLVEAKAHLRVDHSDDDSLIEGLIEAATAYLDGWTGILGRALVTQTWRQDLAAFGDPIRLPLSPVASVSSVTYYDQAGAEQTLSASAYVLLADSAGAYIDLASGQSWPAVANKADPVRVTFVTGYGAASDVPRPIRQAILLHLGLLYEHREAASGSGPAAELPLAHGALVAPYRLRRL